MKFCNWNPIGSLEYAVCASTKQGAVRRSRGSSDANIPPNYGKS